MSEQQNRWTRIKKNGNFKRKNKQIYLKIKNQEILGLSRSPQSTVQPSTSSSMNNSNDLAERSAGSGNEGTTDKLELDHMEATSSELRFDLEVEDESSFSESLLNVDFCRDLREWSIKYNIKQTALKDLMLIINKRLPNLLPKDPRTLLQPPNSVTLQDVGKGQYWHQGLEVCLDKIVTRLEELNTISIKINIIGIPTYKSSKNEFWPILFNIKKLSDLSPMVIGIYYGKSKPCDLNLFLNPFVEDLKTLMKNGYYISTKQIIVKLECFICDSPARSFIKGVANFNSQNGCQKCTITGEYSYTSRTNYYPRRVCSKRTDHDHDFRSKLYGLHHKLDSPLLKLPIDMIQDFPIADSLHLIDLGITKRCLTGWRDGNFGLYKTKWSAKDIENISKFLIKCRMPAEIHRAVRGLDCLAHWKGLEYRTFLHYISIVVLQQYLPSDAYQHFLLFFCAITICSSEHYKNLLNFAQKLLEQFVEYYGDFYGADYITSNVHNLYHVVDDVKRFGILPKISAYPFESKLFQIKNLLRTGHKPLVQAAKRLQEQSQIGSIEKVEATFQPFLKKEIFNIYTIYSDHLTGLSNAQFYSCIKLKEYSLRSDLENNWILNNKKEIISFKFAVLQDNVISIIGCRLKHIFDYFDTPIKSSFLNIYSSNCEEGLPKIFKLEEIKCKMVRVSEPENKCFVFIPLLHTLSF